jgi:hypothetical protein
MGSGAIERSPTRGSVGGLVNSSSPPSGGSRLATRRSVIVALALLLVVGIGWLSYALLLGQRAARATSSDDQYVGIAKQTNQGVAYFRRFPSATCAVTRGWNVVVNCDYPQPPPLQPYLEKFRVQIDPATSAVVGVEIQTNAP